MRIKNKTKYKIDNLLNLFAVCISQIEFTIKYQKVIIKYSHSSNVSGYYNTLTRNIIIKLPIHLDWCKETWIDKKDYNAQVLALVFIHEVGHSIGIPHRYNMTIEGYYGHFISSLNDKDYPICLDY